MDLHLEYICDTFQSKKTNYETHKIVSKVEAVVTKKAKYENLKKQKQFPDKFLNKKIKNRTIDDLLKVNENYNTLNTDSDYESDLHRVLELSKNDK